MKTKFLTLKYVENYPSLCHTTFPVCPRVCGELERVHHAVARLVDGPLPGPHGVLKLQILKVYPHLTNTGVALKIVLKIISIDLSVVTYLFLLYSHNKDNLSWTWKSNRRGSLGFVSR